MKRLSRESGTTCNQERTDSRIRGTPPDLFFAPAAGGRPDFPRDKPGIIWYANRREKNSGTPPGSRCQVRRALRIKEQEGYFKDISFNDDDKEETEMEKQELSMKELEQIAGGEISPEVQQLLDALKKDLQTLQPVKEPEPTFDQILERLRPGMQKREGQIPLPEDIIEMLRKIYEDGRLIQRK